jgi:hypothetical protein
MSWAKVPITEELCARKNSRKLWFESEENI